MKKSFSFRRFNLNTIPNSIAILESEDQQIIRYKLENPYCVYKDISIYTKPFGIIVRDKTGEQFHLYPQNGHFEARTSMNLKPAHTYSLIQNFAKSLIEEENDLPKPTKENLEKIIKNQSFNPKSL